MIFLFLYILHKNIFLRGKIFLKLEGGVYGEQDLQHGRDLDPVII